MRQRGFTLLEMMIAMAILAGALTWLIVGMSRNIKAENHAKLMSTATFLARGRITELEDELYEKGFGEFDKEQNGTFEDKGFQRFAWRVIVDKVELPNSDQVQTMMTNAQQARQQLDPTAAQNPQNSANGTSSSANPMAAGASAMSSQFGIIKDVLEQGIRRVTVQVTWLEGRKTEDVSVVTYFTDVRKVDQAIQLSIPTSLTGGGTGGSGGTSGSGGAGTSGGTTTGRGP